MKFRMRAIRLLGLLLALAGCGVDTEVAERVDKIDGDEQTATVGNTLLTALSVRAMTRFGDPVEGQLVNFRVTAGGGTVDSHLRIPRHPGHRSALMADSIPP